MVTIQEILPYVIGALCGSSVTCLLFARGYGKLAKGIEEAEAKEATEDEN